MSVNPRINITTVNSIDTKTACFDGVGDYDPSLERFLGEDPIGFDSNDFNFYTYVSNDPINFIDPNGTTIVAVVSIEAGYSLLALTPAGWVVLGIVAVTVTCTAAYVYYNDKYPTPDPYTSAQGNDYTGHGDNPEGKTGNGAGWQKHSGRRSGKSYGDKKNQKRGPKNQKYKKPQNPNKKK